MPKYLYHGTSLQRWKAIQKDRLLKPAKCGVKAVSMSEDIKVAEYFAQLARKEDSSKCVILKINAKDLQRKSFDLEPFSDPIWGEGECDWEREYICESPIPLEYVTIIK